MALDKWEKSLTTSLTFSLTIILYKIIKVLNPYTGILTLQIQYKLVKDSYDMN